MQPNSGKDQAHGGQAHFDRSNSSAGGQPTESLNAAQTEDQFTESKFAQVPIHKDGGQRERFDTPQSLTQASHGTHAGGVGSGEEGRSSSMPTIPSEGQVKQGEQAGLPKGTDAAAGGGTGAQTLPSGHRMPGEWATRGGASVEQPDAPAGSDALQEPEASENKSPQAPYGSLSQ